MYVAPCLMALHFWDLGTRGNREHTARKFAKSMCSSVQWGAIHHIVAPGRVALYR